VEFKPSYSGEIWQKIAAVDSDIAVASINGMLLLRPLKEKDYVFTCVCLSVCLSANDSNHEWIFT